MFDFLLPVWNYIVRLGELGPILAQSGIWGLMIGQTLMYATPLLFTALGGTISENAGIVNIGLEGMMTLGAFVGAAIAYATGNSWLGLLAGGLAAGAMAAFHALACITFKAKHVVSGIAMNFLGPGLALFLCVLFFEGSTQTKPIDLANKITKFGANIFPPNTFFDFVFNQYATVYIAFILVAVVWVLLYKTKLGLRIRSVGEHPKAADTLGVKVYRVQYFATILGGFFAGLGGASLSIAIASNFRPATICGQGFIALAAMIFGKWKPQGAMGACLLFGGTQALIIVLGRQDIMNIINIPVDILNMIPFIITLLILVTVVKKSAAPAHDGVPYDKGEDAKL